MKRRWASITCILVLAGCSSDAPREWTPPDRDPENPVVLDLDVVPEDETVFPAGVMAGEPRAASMLVWTHTTRTTGLRLKVWIPGIDPANPDKVDLLHDGTVAVADGGYVHEVVTGLVPGRRHGYAFFVEETAGQPTARSRAGSFVVPPPAGALVRLTLSGTHGTREDHAPYPTLEKNAAFESFTLYLHLGDAIYADSAETREDFRRMWLENWQTSGFRAVLGAAVYLPVFDDHEVENSYNPEGTDADRIATALGAFYEANPLARIDGAPLRLWRSFRWGDTVELFILDSRGERKPSTREGPDAVYLGAEQMAWLKQGLKQSPAVFKLILNSVPIWDLPELWMTVFDRWEGYAAQRTELIDYLLQENIQDVYFITGDFHMATVGRLDPPGGPGDNLWEFILGPGAQSNPLGDREYILETTGYDPLPPEQFLWGHPTELMSYVDLDPIADPPTLTLRYYDPEGLELFRVVFEGGQPVEE